MANRQRCLASRVAVGMAGEVQASVDRIMTASGIIIECNAYIWPLLHLSVYVRRVHDYRSDICVELGAAV